MEGWSEEYRKRIVDKLQERGVNRPCGRCGHDKFTLIDGFAVFGLVMKLESEHVERLLPSACVACSKCGYVTFHTLAPLGLLAPDQPTPPADQQVTS
jgi:ribosomal protein S27AE